MRLPYEWKQGQHMAIVGRTGSGKSQLAAALLPHRQYRIIVKTKDDDGVLYDDAERVTTLSRLKSRYQKVYELVPDYERQAVEIWKTLEWVWRTGGWCVSLDELFYLIDSLGLEKQINKLLTQGRSKGITVVSGMQRPARVSRFALSESTHVICFAVEGREAKTIGEATNKRMEAAVQELGRFEFAWYNAISRSVWCGKLNFDTGALDAVSRQTSGAEKVSA